MADNKLVKGDKLFNDELQLFKNIIAPLDDKLYIKNIKSICSIEFKFPIESLTENTYIINEKYINYSHNDNDLEFLNGLIWTYLESNNKFIKQIKIFTKLCNDYKKFHSSIDPLYSLEFDKDFEKFLIEKTSSSSNNKINTFEDYRDLFYDKFGIDIVEYYNIYLNDHPRIDQRGEIHKINILKNISSKFYPYKSKKIQYNIETKQPIHRFIKRYTSYLEISPFVNDKTISSTAKDYLKLIKNHVKGLDHIFRLYYEFEENEQYNTANSFKSIKSSVDSFKKAFLVLEIIRHYQLENEIDKAIRYFNFFILQKYIHEIYIDESNLFEMLEIEDEFENIEGEIKLSNKVPMTPVQDGTTKENIRKIIKILLQELP